MGATLRPKIGMRRADLVQSKAMRTMGLLVARVPWSALQERGRGATHAADPAALKAQQELLARRDKLLAAAPEAQGSSARSSSIEIKDIAGQPAATRPRSRRSSTASKLEHQTPRTRGLQRCSPRRSTPRWRAATRPRSIAQREAAVAEREAAVAAREKRSPTARSACVREPSSPRVEGHLQRESVARPSCSRSPAPARTAQYTKKDVERSPAARARRRCTRRAS